MSSDRTEDLMKKGLRPSHYYIPFFREYDRTEDLMKKGLRHRGGVGVREPGFDRTEDLMKKGLRRTRLTLSSSPAGQNRRPDEEGVKTDPPAPRRRELHDRTEDLMKKGLRRALNTCFVCQRDRTEDLMKKGLRPRVMLLSAAS